ncbi:MAG: hypothetical protein MJA84_00655 [Firmicutes bacterium]|nr:hypothetical protein [Bacillota bacterium]
MNKQQSKDFQECEEMSSCGKTKECLSCSCNVCIASVPNKAETKKEAVIREEVRWFTRLMEERLQANDHKGGWENCSLEWLVIKLTEEVGEVAALICKHDLCREKIIKEAADVANMAMMIADQARLR